MVQLNNKETARAFSRLIKYCLLQLNFMMFGEFVQHFLCKLEFFEIANLEGQQNLDIWPTCSTYLAVLRIANLHVVII